MSGSRPAVLRPSVVLGIYGLMTAGALGWGFFRGHPNIFVLPPDCSWWPSGIGAWLSRLGAVRPVTSTIAAVVLGGGAGLLVGLLVVAFGRWAAERWEWVVRLHEAFMDVLGDMGRTEILVAAVASSVGEEALFRGLLLPTLGLWLSSAIFGVVHLGPGKRFAAWPFMAFVMGLGFGTLAMGFGNLAGPIAAHFIINFLNLTELSRSARERARRAAADGLARRAAAVGLARRAAADDLALGPEAEGLAVGPEADAAAQGSPPSEKDRESDS